MKSIGPGRSLANLKMRGKRTMRLRCGCRDVRDLRPIERDRIHKMETQIANALIAAEDVASIRCASCQAPIESDETTPYCLCCGLYWEDVRNGLWEEPDDDLSIGMVAQAEVKE